MIIKDNFKLNQLYTNKNKHLKIIINYKYYLYFILNININKVYFKIK